MRARDVMSRPVVTVTPDTAIAEAGRLLAAHGFAAVPVVDAQGCLVGIVSEADLLRHRVPADPTAHLRRDGLAPVEHPHRVAEVMHSPVISMAPDADAADLAAVMLDRHLRSIPIVADGAVVGIVSRRDLLRTVVRTDDALSAEIRHRLEEYGGAGRAWKVAVADGVAEVTGDIRDEGEREVIAVLARAVPGVADVRVVNAAG